MKELNKIESIVMLVGAVLMIIGATLLIFGFELIAPWIFFVGALAFTTTQLKQRYDGTNFTLRRLRKIMIAGDIFFLLSALMMIENSYQFFLPAFLKIWPEDGYITYIQFIHNNWVVLLLVAAVLELYSTNRITYELRKDAKKN